MKAIRICGQVFSDALIRRINVTVASQPSLGRRQLSRQVCAWLNWRNDRGALKEMSCRVALKRLEDRGRIQLPASRGKMGGPRRFRRGELPAVATLACGLKEVGEVRLELVTGVGGERSRWWNELIERYHYLGYQPLAGAQLRYLIWSEAGLLGAVGFGASAWRVAARDRWIGWDDTQRTAGLKYVVNNARFLIVPTVQVPHLASKVLGLSARRLGKDWRERYGYEPVLLETYVERDRFFATSYRAAGWEHVGETKGRGKKDGTHQAAEPVKEMYVKPLAKDWRERLGGREGQWAAPDPRDWAEEEFHRVVLGDARLKQRLYVLARDFYAQPEANIPQACESRTKTQAAYRFFGHPEVQRDLLLAAHKAATLRRLRGETVALAVQDTMMLNYSGHLAAEDLGDIGTKAGQTKGLIVHETMAFDVQGLALGLLDVQTWIRKPEHHGKKGVRKTKPIKDKESYKWLKSFEAVRAAQGQLPRTLLVSVGDREADIYELFERAVAAGEGQPKLLVRASQNRVLREEQGHLWEWMQQERVAGTLEVEVPRKPGQKKRQARLAISFSAVELTAPKGRSGSVKLWAVYARELHPPRGVEPLAWMLLTTLGVESFEQAVEKVRWYMVRWKIEVYHKVLKSGCRLEDRQMRSRKELEACLAVDLVVGWRILHLTERSRRFPEETCGVHFEDYEWKALVWYVNKTEPSKAQEPTLRTIVRMIASLGGFLGRKCDGEPGCQTLWRGWRRLKDIIECYLLAFPSGRSGGGVQPAYATG